MKSGLNGKIKVTLRTGQTDQSLSFDKPTLTLGRAPDSDIFISDSKVSKKHLSIVFENGFIKIKDLNSSNGTFVNGHRIIANNYILVTDDDLIRVGNVDSAIKIKYEPRPVKVIAPPPPQFVSADPDKNTQAIFPQQVVQQADKASAEASAEVSMPIGLAKATPQVFDKDESLEQKISQKIQNKLDSEDQKISHNFKNLEIMRPLYENPTKHAQDIIAEANNIKKTILKNAEVKSDLIINEAHKKANQITEEKIAEYKKNVEHMLRSAQIDAEKIKEEALGEAYELKSEAEKMLAESLEESRNLISKAGQKIFDERVEANQKINAEKLAFDQGLEEEKNRITEEINQKEIIRLDVVYREKIYAKYQEIEAEMAIVREKHKKSMESLQSEFNELDKKKQAVLDFLKNNKTIFDEKNNEIIKLDLKLNGLMSENKKTSDLLDSKNKELTKLTELKEKNEALYADQKKTYDVQFVDQKIKSDALILDLKNKIAALTTEKQTAKEGFDKVISELHLKKEELKKVEEKIIIDRKMAFKNLSDEISKKRTEENEKLEEFKKQQAKEFQKINDHNLKLFEKIGIDISHDIAQKLEVSFQKKGRFVFNEAVETISHSMNSHLALSSKDQKQELKVEEKILNWQNQQKKKTYQTYFNALIIYGIIFWSGNYLKNKLSQDPMAEQRRELASKAQEAVEKNKYVFIQTDVYYDTYVENTLYNKSFHAAYMNPANQSEWHKLATKYLLKKWKVSEEKSIEVIAGSRSLVQNVEERRETFTKTRFKTEYEKLTVLEKELKEKHSQAMGSLVRYEDYKRLEKDFFTRKITDLIKN